MAISKNTLTLFKWLYWVFLTMAHLYLTYIFFATERVILAILWLIAGFMLIFIFYFYYFPISDPGSNWPPFVSACPDYLTQIAPGKCVDYVGLHSPMLKKSDATLPPPTDPAHIFNSSGNTSQKAMNAQQYGLSWQGVF